MNETKELISLWGSPKNLADESGFKVGTVRQWGNRNSIPKGAWPEIVKSAESHGLPVTFETLAKIHTRPSRAA